MYFADSNNHRIRKVTVSTGIITTIVGTGTGSYSGDNGPATSATLSYPYGVALDSSGISQYIVFGRNVTLFRFNLFQATCTSLKKVITVSVR